MYIRRLTCFFIVFLLISKLEAQEIDLKRNDLLNGSVYQEQKSRIKGHPFLLDDKLYTGHILYKDIHYSDLLLKYDIFKQRLIYFQEIDPKLPRFITLNLNYLESFELLSNSKTLVFTNKFADLDIESKVKYYQIIYDNKIKYIKGTLKIIDISSGVTDKNKYVERVYHYLIIKGEAHKIKSRRDIILLFDEYKKEIRKYIRKNQLAIKLGSDNDILKLLVFCESFIEQ